MAEGERADKRAPRARAKAIGRTRESEAPSGQVDAHTPDLNGEAQSLPPEPFHSGIFSKLERHAIDDPLAVLARDTRCGNRRAEAELLRRLTPPLRRYLRTRVPPDGDREDALQESLVALTGAFREFRGESSVLHFAIQVARRVAAARRRSRKRDRRHEARAAQLELPLADHPDNPDACTVNRRRGRQLLAFLSALPAAQAETLVLRAVGHSIAEVAALTGVPSGTVRTRLRRAQQRLRRQLKADPAVLELRSS